VSFLPAPLEPTRPALLTRVTAATRIVVGAVWLGVAVLTFDPIVPARLCAVALAVLVFGSGLPLERVPRRLAPLLIAMVGLALFTTIAHASNGDPSVQAIVHAGPLRITGPAISAGLALALRLFTAALTGLLAFSTADPTAVADSLAQQWHLPDRFAYGAVAALRIAPIVAGDWGQIAAARRMRGLQPASLLARLRWYASVLLVLLVAALRRAERLALAMDARGFDSGIRRSYFRPVHFRALDGAVLVGGVAIAFACLLVAR
jgi:energy-coupling factor transport system permease protein